MNESYINDLSVVKIAITGAPGSGKTSVFQRLKANQRYFASVGYIPEIASHLFLTLPQCKLRDENKHLLQAVIAQEQILLESTISDLLVKAYSDFAALRGYGLDLNNIPPYDLVINLRSGDIFKGTENNPFRTETPDEISTLDLKTHEVWSNPAHAKNYVELPYYHTIEDKTAACAKVINDYLRLPLFKESSLE